MASDGCLLEVVLQHPARCGYGKQVSGSVDADYGKAVGRKRMTYHTLCALMWALVTIVAGAA